MANQQNIDPYKFKKGQRTREEQAKLAHIGGVASGVSRRRKANIIKDLEDLLSSKCSDPKLRERMASQGIPEESMTNSEAFASVLMAKVLDGDIMAAKLLVDILGQTAGHKHKDEELKERKKEFKYQQDKDAKASVNTVDVSEDDPISKALKGEFGIAD